VIHTRLRRIVVVLGLVVALGSATALALASRRIVAEQAAYHAPASARCTPTTLNRSALLRGTPLTVSPLPGTYAASQRTQISLLGVPAQQIRTVRVKGSASGSHPGRLRAYSQGDGASFVQHREFTPGETVTVRGTIAGAPRPTRFAYAFTIAHQDAIPFTKPSKPHLQPDEVQSFHSRPDLEAPVIAVTARTPSADPAAQRRAPLIFAAPFSGPGDAGPMIFDEAGNLVWFSPDRAGTVSANLQLGQLDGQSVLTYWHGYIHQQGFGEGEDVVLNRSYRPILRVHAGNGYKADLHEFRIADNHTAVLTVFDPIYCDLSSLGGPSGGAVTDGIYQEIDLRTGLVRREWHSVDHVPLSDSYSSAVGTSTVWPFDYFHLNSIAQLANGRTVISARNTWGVYELDSASGRVVENIGGRRSQIKLASGASPAFQHDARVLPDGTISLFDNGAVPKVHKQSRGLILAIDQSAHTGAVVAQYQHTSALSSGSQGNLQVLANGDVLIGWGARPFVTEYTPAGKVVFDAHMKGPYESYRSYRYEWSGEPSEPPAIAAIVNAHSGTLSVYASWNGDTRTASWRVLAGNSAHALAPVATVPRAGFETKISPHRARYVAVQALDETGAVLATSRTVRG
jgi:Arylsulfotransferase (ASST)